MKTRPVVRAVALFLMMLMIVGICTPIVAGAEDDTPGKYYSWIRDRVKETTAPANKDGAGTNSSNYDDDNPGTIEKLLASVVASIGTGINKALKGREQVDAEGNIIPSAIDASTTGIIMGKITHGNSFFVFDLTDDNVYGRIGASIYVILRAFCFAILFILTLISIIKSLYISDGKGLSRLKDSLMTTVIVMILLFMMPQIVDWLCEVRDKVCVILYEGMAKLLTGDTAQGTAKLTEMISLEEQYFSRYDETPTVLNAFVYTMVCCIPLVFIISYLKIAVQQTILFGLFPVFAVLSPNDKKSLSEWSTVVFTNIFIPAIDVALMLLPALVLEVFLAVAGSGAGLLKALVTIVMVMGIVPVRNQILTMLGNKFGISAGMGLIGAGLLAARAVQGVAAMASNSSKSSKSEEKESASTDDGGRDTDESLMNAVAEHKAEMGEIPPNPNVEVHPEGPTATDPDHQEANQTAILESTQDTESNETAIEGDSTTNNTGIETSSLTSVPPSATEDEAALEAASRAGSANETVYTEETVHGETAPENGSASGGHTVIQETPQTVQEPIADVVAANTVTANTLAQSGSSGRALAAVIDDRAGSVNRAGEDKAGRQFNMARAANLQSIDNMKEATRKLDADNVQHQHVIVGAQKTLNDSNASDEIKESAQATIASAKAAINENNAKKQVLRDEISKRQEVERGMAKTSASHGRSDKTFESASDFRRQLEHETKVRNIANYKNFNIEGSAFSQKERAEFERTKEIHDARVNIAKAMAKGTMATAGVATAGIAALSVAAGGENTMRAVASQGISMASDPNLHALPGAVGRMAGTINQATEERLSTYGRAAGRGASYMGRAGMEYVHDRMKPTPAGRVTAKAGEIVKEKKGQFREQYWEKAKHAVKEADRKIREYGEKE